MHTHTTAGDCGGGGAASGQYCSRRDWHIRTAHELLVLAKQRSSVAVQEVSILFLVPVRRVKPLAPRKDKGGNRLQFLRHSDWSDSRQREPSWLSNSRLPRTETVRIGSRCAANADLRPPLSSPQRKTEPQVPLRQQSRRSVRMRQDKEHHAQGSLHVCSSWSEHGMKFCARLTQRRYLEYTLTGSQGSPPLTTASQRYLLRRHTTLNAPPFAYERTSIACLSRLSRIQGGFQTRLLAYGYARVQQDMTDSAAVESVVRNPRCECESFWCDLAGGRMTDHPP